MTALTHTPTPAGPVSLPARLPAKLLRLLSTRQRVQAALLLAALVARAALDLVGVASVAPFMRVVSDPTVLHRHASLRWAYEAGGFASDRAFLTALGLGVIVLLAASNGFSAYASWAVLRFGWSANHQLSLRLLRGYLAQPYAFFVQRNSATLHKTLLAEVSTAVTGVLMPALMAVAQALVVAAMAAVLVLLDPGFAVAAIVVLGGAYGLLYLAVRRKQARLGRERADANQARFRVAAEAFGGIKDVKVLQREETFLALFAPPSRRLSQAMASNGAVAQVPRYLLETLAFGGIIAVVLRHLHLGRDVSQIVPALSLYALAGYRLMPALQTLFASVSGIRFNLAALDSLCADLDRLDAPAAKAAGPAPALPLRDAIRLESVSFQYPEARDPALSNVTLTIKRNEAVGLVGASGSGKTTLADLLLGLYFPTEGSVSVDGTVLDPRTATGWRPQLGYVPQHIFLSDDSIARNIAFGIPAAEVDSGRVERAARIAHLHEFVLALPGGYDTLVGERGVRLSGGQRQRIGIARALYHDPDVLIMDEATSALDGVTEDAVMEAIEELAGRKTVILIAHRLSTVRACDRLFLLERGRLLDQGSYDALLRRSATFRAMARAPEPAHLPAGELQTASR